MRNRVKDILFRLSIFGLLFVVPMVNGCGPQPQHDRHSFQEINTRTFEPQQDNMATIENAQYIHYHFGEGINSFCVKFVRFKFNGHYYIMKDNSQGIMFHSPDCDCQNNTSSSILTTPLNSSSIFNW